MTTTFDDADRITSSGYSHDADGRMTARPGQQLVWDGLGRLTTVKTTGGTTISAYTYDALDRLRQVTRSGTTLRFRYMGMTTQVLQVWNVTTSASVRKHAWDRMGTMLAHFTGLNSGIAHHGTNGHRDITWTADSTGAITRTARYDPWGGLLASSGSTMVPGGSPPGGCCTGACGAGSRRSGSSVAASTTWRVDSLYAAVKRRRTGVLGDLGIGHG